MFPLFGSKGTPLGIRVRTQSGRSSALKESLPPASTRRAIFANSNTNIGDSCVHKILKSLNHVAFHDNSMRRRPTGCAVNNWVVLPLPARRTATGASSTSWGPHGIR